MIISFNLETIKDTQVIKALQRIKEVFRPQVLLDGQWRFYEITFTKAVDNLKYPHGLKFTPLDVLQTYISADAAVIWNYNEFDGENLDITVSAPCTVRAFIGRYQEGSIV